MENLNTGEYTDHTEIDNKKYHATWHGGRCKVTNDQFKPILKTRKGWVRYMNSEAKKETKKHNRTMDGIVSWSKSRNCFNLFLASPPVK